MDSSVCVAESSPSPPSLNKLRLNDDDDEGREVNKADEEEEEEDWSESERQGFISPHLNPEGEFCTQSTQFAIEHYNKKKGGQLVLSKVVCVNRKHTPYMPLYITFVAKDTADGRTRTYQAVTEMIPGEGERVVMFRPKTRQYCFSLKPSVKL